MPATVFKTEAEFISALIWRLIVTGLLAGALGMLFSNGNVWASALFGAGISLLTLVGLRTGMCCASTCIAANMGG